MPLPLLTLDGRVVGDPQFKFLDNGTALLRFRMVCADRKKGADGKWYDAETLWITVSAFGRLAENAFDSLRDRDAVIVVGKLSTAEWVDETGAKKTAPKIVAGAIGPSVAFTPRQHATAAWDAQAPTQDAPASPPRVAPTSRVPAGGGDDPWAY